MVFDPPKSSLSDSNNIISSLYVALQPHDIATSISPWRPISPEEFPNSSRENENSPPRAEIKLRKNEMKLRKKEIKVPKIFSIAP